MPGTVRTTVRLVAHVLLADLWRDERHGLPLLRALRRFRFLRRQEVLAGPEFRLLLFFRHDTSSLPSLPVGGGGQSPAPRNQELTGNLQHHERRALRPGGRVRQHETDVLLFHAIRVLGRRRRIASRVHLVYL